MPDGHLYLTLRLFQVSSINIKKFEKSERVSLPDRGIEPAIIWSIVVRSTNWATEALNMNVGNLKVFILQFCFLQYMHCNCIFFQWFCIQSVWFYKKLCYKTLLLFYIHIFQFDFKHWYIQKYSILLLAVQTKFFHYGWYSISMVL